jgi:hypothetical protein
MREIYKYGAHVPVQIFAALRAVRCRTGRHSCLYFWHHDKSEPGGLAKHEDPRKATIRSERMVVFSLLETSDSLVFLDADGRSRIDGGPRHLEPVINLIPKESS